MDNKTLYFILFISAIIAWLYANKLIGLLLSIVLIWLAISIIKPAAEEDETSISSNKEINHKDNQVNSENWKEKLTPQYRNFLEKYGSQKGESYNDVIKRFKGQKYLDSSTEEQSEIILEEKPSQKDWIHQLTEDQKNFFKSKILKDDETLESFLNRYFTYKKKNSLSLEKTIEKDSTNKILKENPETIKIKEEKTSDNPKTKNSNKRFNLPSIADIEIIEIKKSKNEESIAQSKIIKPLITKTKQKIAKIKTKESRVCRKCGVLYPLNKDYFGHTQKGNFRRMCRICMNKNTKKYAEANPDSVLRRSKKRQLSSKNWTATESMKEILHKEQKGLCGLCGGILEKDFLNNKLCQVDHLIPVAQGGANDLSNLVIAHRKCNQEKANKTLGEYFKWREKVGEPKSSYSSIKIVKALSINR